jgi:hypothetical protein
MKSEGGKALEEIEAIFGTIASRQWHHGTVTGRLRVVAGHRADRLTSRPSRTRELAPPHLTSVIGIPLFMMFVNACLSRVSRWVIVPMHHL